MLRNRLIYLLLLGLLGLKSEAQEAFLKRITPLQPDSIFLSDTNTIIQSSIRAFQNESMLLQGTHYRFDPFTQKIFLLHDSIKITSIEWETLPTSSLKKKLNQKSTELIKQSFKETKNPFLYEGSSGSNPIIESKGMQLNGNIGRGFTGGNTQNLAVNSNLNLQITGKIADLDVRAAISDENNPIQPEGNTQQIQDFDKVFIQLSKNSNQFTIGDYEMISPGSGYFLRYNKKLRGIQINSIIPLKNHTQLKLLGEGAISRGRFSRNSINAIEGNQGPYKLTGASGETYIIIISGTEAVYIDGEKLKRGEQNDYIIDYNSGEITFMPRRLITRYNRIVVEFQYADRNYARSVFQWSTSYETEKYQLRLSYYSEQDHKSQPYLQNLSDSDKQILTNAGDQSDLAVTSGASVIREFTASRILYRKIDTIGYNPVYVYTNIKGADSVFYDVKFSYVGIGKGNYILSSNAANGRTFKWIAPIAGVKQGDYEPVVQLTASKRNQMFILGGDFKIGKYSQLNLEFAHSDFNKNTFSEKDKADDGGNGFKLNYIINVPLKQNVKHPWNLGAEIKYEEVDASFRYIERYRDVEFDRTWNRLLTNQATQDTGYREQIIAIKTSLNHDQNGVIFYQLGYYNRNQLFTGLQNSFGTDLRWHNTNILSKVEYLKTALSAVNSIDNETRSLKTDISHLFTYFRGGIKYENEQSLFKKSNDSLIIGSYGYDLTAFYLKNRDSSNFRYQLEYNRRNDKLPQSENLKAATIGSNYLASLDYTQKNSNRISFTFTYRELSISDPSLINQAPERTILSRFEYDYSLWKRMVTANTYFQLGSGNELRRDFQFLQVLPGQGLYLWKDFNRDGTQSTDEFVTASSADKNRADYIKVFLPTNNSTRVNTNQFNQTLNINPALVMHSKNGIKGIIARFSNQSAIRLDRKTSDLNDINFINPFASIQAVQKITQNNLFRNNFFFNRSNSNWGADYTYMLSKGSNLLAYGTDTRGKEEHQTSIRWNVNSSTGLVIGYGWGERYYYSEFYNENNYKYTYTEVRPKLIYQATRQVRITLIYADFNALTLPVYGNYKGNNSETGAEWRYSMTGAGVFNFKYSMYQIQFNGNLASPLGYDMLQGFSNGQNQVWNISYQQMFGSNVQFTLNYDGRQSSGNSAIHIGRMEARYIF